MALQLIVKIGIAIFIIVWALLGIWLCVNYNRLFGPHKDDPSETPGARSFGVTHIVAIWIGGMALAIYYICK